MKFELTNVGLAGVFLLIFVGGLFSGHMMSEMVYDKQLEYVSETYKDISGKLVFNNLKVCGELNNSTELKELADMCLECIG